MLIVCVCVPFRKVSPFFIILRYYYLKMMILDVGGTLILAPSPVTRSNGVTFTSPGTRSSGVTFNISPSPGTRSSGVILVLGLVE